jgi:predicted nucleotidyltransferase component of viral defense system
MILHKSPDVFRDAVEATAQSLNLRPVFVEKDYWIVCVLKMLAASEFADKVIFKGGTSLSKAYQCIQRFSEDIDLAILSPGDYSGNQLSKLIKSVETRITKGLTYQPGHVQEKKFGRNRSTVYAYERFLDENDFGVVKDYILVEINCLTNPVPHEIRSIQTYIGQYLNTEGYQNMTIEYELNPFNVKVLSLRRTLFEKILSLNRLSYDGTAKLIEKARHFYDIHKLLQHPDFKEDLMNKSDFEILKEALEDDNVNETMTGDWKGKPLSSSPLFADLESTWANVAPGYRSNLQGLIWDGNLPAQDQILATLKRIQTFIASYDENQNSGI